VDSANTKIIRWTHIGSHQISEYAGTIHLFDCALIFADEALAGDKFTQLTRAARATPVSLGRSRASAASHAAAKSVKPPGAALFLYLVRQLC
jgi:hypothetical protein